MDNNNIDGNNQIHDNSDDDSDSDDDNDILEKSNYLIGSNSQVQTTNETITTNNVVNTTAASIVLTCDRMQSISSNRCDLLWQGILPKRIFTGFKFQESKTQIAARKLLKSKGVNHYWDMVENADNLIVSAAPPSLF